IQVDAVVCQDISKLEYVLLGGNENVLQIFNVADFWSYHEHVRTAPGRVPAYDSDVGSFDEFHVPVTARQKIYLSGQEIFSIRTVFNRSVQALRRKELPINRDEDRSKRRRWTRCANGYVGCHESFLLSVEFLH